MSDFPSFSDYLRRKVGPNWVLHRRTERIQRQYGGTVVCLSQKEYTAHAVAFERETGFAAHGAPGEPCARIKNAALDLFAACKSQRLMLFAMRAVWTREDWGVHPELEKAIAQTEAAITKAETSK